MSEQPASADGQGMPAAGAGTAAVAAAGSAAASGAAGAQDRPELAVGGAFVGGVVLALILKRLAR